MRGMNLGIVTITLSNRKNPFAVTMNISITTHIIITHGIIRASSKIGLGNSLKLLKVTNMLWRLRRISLRLGIIWATDMQTLDGFKMLLDVSKRLFNMNRRCAALHNLGNAYEELNNFTEAIACYSAAIDINNRHHESFFGNGCCYDALGQTAQALIEYQKPQRLILSIQNIVRLRRCTVQSWTNRRLS